MPAVWYRVRQFGRALTARVSLEERALVARVLPAPAAALFYHMPRQDQRHGLDVLYGLQARGEDAPELLAAALLHDIGKFTREFLENGICNKGNLRSLHTTDFLKKESSLCATDLLKRLADEDLGNAIQIPNDVAQIKHLGDLLRFHHGRDLKKVYEKETDFPMLVYLMVYADTIDSASSKGGASFRAHNRTSRLDSSYPYNAT